MKKLIMLTAILFVSAGVAFCQSNTAHIQQANRNDQASIRQDGRANSAQVGQGKADNLLDVDGNIINNIDPGTAKNNEVAIHQVKNNNYSAVLQGVGGGIALNNQAKVLQNGNQNEGEVVQGAAEGSEGRATGNEATLTQTGNSDVALIFQGIGGTAIGNKATFIQNGSGGSSFDNGILQGNDGGTVRNSTALIRQDGDRNSARIKEGVGAGVVTLNSHATISQLSNNNEAIIDISGVNQNATIVQN